MYKLILAIRYLLKRRITCLAVLAVALCVFMVVVVMTVMTGLVRDFKAKNHNWVGDCVVSTDSLVGFSYYEEFVKILESKDFIKAVSPAIKSYSLSIFEGSDYSRPVGLMGIYPRRHREVTNFADSIYYHKKNDVAVFEPVYDSNLPGCVPGIAMLRVRDEFGKYNRHKPGYRMFDYPNDMKFSISLSSFPLTAKGALAKAGLGFVNTKTFYFSDDFHSGIAGVDKSVVYLPFETAQKLCGMNAPRKRVSAIFIKFTGDVELQKACDNVATAWRKFVETKSGRKGSDLLKNVHVQSWKSYRRDTIAAIEKEQIMMTAAFAMIGIITVFILFVVFYMIVSHKSKDIGILKSVGVSSGNVLTLFLGFGFLVGLAGSVIGTVGGWLFLEKINDLEKWLYDHYGFQLWNRMLYAIDDIPNNVEFDTVAVIISSAILAGLLGAFVPAIQAARRQPVETLQVNQL